MKMFTFTVLIIFLLNGCGGTSSSTGKSHNDDLLLHANIKSPVLVVHGFKKDIKISSSRKNAVFKILNYDVHGNFAFTDKYRGYFTYWADDSIGSEESVKIVATTKDGWQSNPLTIKFKTVSILDAKKERVLKTGADDGGAGADRIFTKNSDQNIIDPFGNIWENNLTAKSNFYLLAQNRCEVLRLTHLGSHWRVPTVDETLNLIDYSKTANSSMLDSIFDENNQSVWIESKEGNYRVVSQTSGLPYKVSQIDKFPIRCINSSKKRVDHLISTARGLNGITYDFSTSLMWSSMSREKYSIENNASLYCKEYENSSGWRLPNINEVRSIIENGYISQSILNGNSVIVSSTKYNNKDQSVKSSNYIAVYDGNSVQLGVGYSDTLYNITCVKNR